MQRLASLHGGPLRLLIRTPHAQVNKTRSSTYRRMTGFFLLCNRTPASGRCSDAPRRKLPASEPLQIDPSVPFKDCADRVKALTTPK